MCFALLGLAVLEHAGAGCAGNQQRHADVTADAPAVADDIWATDSASDAGVAIAGPVPPTPFKGQKRPPCDPKREKEINGGCWVEIVGAVGEDACGDYYAHSGRCHIPVKAAKRPPVGIEP